MIPVCVCRLAVYCVGKGAICFDLNIQEGGDIVLLLLHCEFDEWMLAVQVDEEFLKCHLAARPNHRGVVNIAEPEVGAKVSILDGVQFKLIQSFQLQHFNFNHPSQASHQKNDHSSSPPSPSRTSATHHMHMLQRIFSQAQIKTFHMPPNKIQASLQTHKDKQDTQDN